MAQQLRATATRQGILEAAARVFDAKGFDATTISHIVERAGCTKGALYFHFASKEMLGDAIIAEQGAWLGPADPNTNPVQQIVDGSFAFATALQENVILRASIRLTVETGTFDGRTPEAYRVWASAIHELLKSAHAQGMLTNGRGLGDVAECISSCITGVQLAAEALTGRKDLNRRLTTLWKLLLPSLVEPETFASLRLTPPRNRRTEPN